ncbi:hypothetical protein EMIT0232MI5_110263 [Pseudomonas sp. IT-232MI5]
MKPATRVLTPLTVLIKPTLVKLWLPMVSTRPIWVKRSLLTASTKPAPPLPSAKYLQPSHSPASAGLSHFWGMTIFSNTHKSPVGAAEGCDLLILIFKSKIKRSQPSAAPTRGFASGWKYAGRPCTMAASETQPQELTLHAR